jgi:hypothetical protein
MRMVTIKNVSFHQFTCISLVVISMLVQQSCIDDEFTRPVRVSLSVIITEQNKTNNILSFESGEIIVNEIQFNGQREAGGDYSFNTESGKKFGPQDFYPQSGNQQELTHFDFPQGIYTSMNWKFGLSDGLERLKEEDDDDEDIGTPGLILHGNYIDPEGVTQQVRIEIDPFESFECLSLTDTGDENINIISGSTYTAVLCFDPYFVFRAISSESLEEADYEDDGISPVLLISSDSNEELYEIILYRLQLSAKIFVSQPE